MFSHRRDMGQWDIGVHLGHSQAKAMVDEQEGESRVGKIGGEGISEGSACGGDVWKTSLASFGRT